jgi:hypothetical protein
VGWFSLRLDLDIGRSLSWLRLLGRGLFLTGLSWSWLFWLLVANKTFTYSLTAHAICLWFNHARGMALDANSERVADVESLLVGET